MKVTTAFRAFIASLLLMLAISSSRAQQPVRSENPETDAVRAKPSQGLVDYALHAINPSDRSYGACLDDARELLIQETVDRVYFWSNLLAMGIAICLFLIVIHQQKLLERREWMAAESLSQYRNALARAEAQAAEATQKNHDLVHGLIAKSALHAPNGGELVDPAERGRHRKAPAAAPSIVPPTPAATVAAPSTTKKDLAVSPASRSLPALTEVAPQESTPGTQFGLFGPDGDFVAKVNALQQQLSTSQERERQLRRQLNESELRFQKEREKIRSLQG